MRVKNAFLIFISPISEHKLRAGRGRRWDEGKETGEGNQNRKFVQVRARNQKGYG